MAKKQKSTLKRSLKEHGKPINAGKTRSSAKSKYKSTKSQEQTCDNKQKDLQMQQLSQFLLDQYEKWSRQSHPNDDTAMIVLDQLYLQKQISLFDSLLSE